MSLAQARAADASWRNPQPTLSLAFLLLERYILCHGLAYHLWLEKCCLICIAPYDAHVIEKFNRVGAVNLARPTCTRLAMGSSNETWYFGTVKK